MITAACRTIYNKFLIGWVAVQYHWILDESVQYLGKSEEIRYVVVNLNLCVQCL